MFAKHILTAVVALFLAVGGTSAKTSSEVQKVYIFGMAASFTDTIVHFTPIEALDSAWLEKKRFLMGREEYSYQLRDYMDRQLQMPHRTCVVVCDKNRKRLEKKYARMMGLYATPPKKGRRYVVHYIDEHDFRFKAVDMTAALEQRKQAEEEQKLAAKEPKKKKEKKKTRPEKPAKGGDVERRPPRG